MDRDAGTRWRDQLPGTGWPAPRTPLTRTPLARTPLTHVYPDHIYYLSPIADTGYPLDLELPQAR